MLILVLLSLAATFIAVALLTNFALFIMVKKTKNYAFVLYQSSINLNISIRKLLHGWNFLALQKRKACLN